MSTSPGDDVDPTWTADSERVAYTDNDGRVMLKDITKKNSAPAPITPEGERYFDLAWAPTADVNLIAMRDDPEDRNSDLCMANVQGNEAPITCKKEPSFKVIRALHWRRTASRSSASASRCPTPPATSGSCAGA